METSATASPSSSPASLFRFGRLFLFVFSPIILLSPAAADARVIRIPPKPEPTEAAATARWLTAQNSWGVLSTISSHLGGAPFGNVVSFSDGLPGSGCGIPYFYLTELDPSARDILNDSRSSFTVNEYPLGTCGNKDPQNPTCAKLTLTGKMHAFYLEDNLHLSLICLSKIMQGFSDVVMCDDMLQQPDPELVELKLVNNQSSEAEFARKALFTKHPEMEGWPNGHKFEFFRLDIENIFLIDWYGGAKPLTPTEYLKGQKADAALLLIYILVGMRRENKEKVKLTARIPYANSKESGPQAGEGKEARVSKERRK
ncbi:hypothetical protein AXF42_Ash002828 [Apostasia shenzhenica]|uniref:CREG-like beta-barrel domain-containing protein n=1 Tax=Apostasia shenzhenica TaxID=1088818 RepID=A0A2I0A7D9_9ASPA|nr:hypothetical protein AXF42_Ash002828 [Apostasia shenzhenica]